MSENIYSSYLSEKVGKIRWKPEGFGESEYFVTGSIDDEENHLTLWQFPQTGDADVDSNPLKISSVPHSGDVTGLEFLSPSTAICSSSTGSVNLLACTEDNLSVTTSWDGLHYLASGDLVSCTDIAVFEEDVATVGEDGRIVLLNVKKEKPVRVIDNADSCPLQSACFLKHNELVTGNLRRQLKIWDLLARNDIPVSSFMPSGDGSATMCVINHPSQRHLLLAGGEDGVITVWDLRKSTYPVNELKAHTTAVAEMMFHPERVEHFFTCSYGGELWQWNATRNVRDPGGDETVWLSSDATKHRMEVSSLIPPLSKPINSMDISRTSLICGGSNESVCLIRKLSF